MSPHDQQIRPLTVGLLTRDIGKQLIKLTVDTRLFQILK